MLGGMGPWASLRFHERLLRLSRERHGARRNHEYPHLLLSNLPLREIIASREHEAAAVAALEAEAARLVGAGADLLALACNTMHAHLERLRRGAGRPFVSAVDAVVERAARDGRRRVGLLATPATIASRLYEAPLRARGIDLVAPDGPALDALAALIARLVDDGDGRDGAGLVRELARGLGARGADAVALGCTELSLLGAPLAGPEVPPAYDSLEALAEDCCRALYGP